MIGEPWTLHSFIDDVTKLQRDRQIRASYQPDEVQFHDPCAVCTAALPIHHGFQFSRFLEGELERIQKERIYVRKVFFLRNLGFIEHTEARRISIEETLHLENSTRRLTIKAAIG